jgi:hypothetical protein
LVVSADLIQHADGRTYLRTGECDGCKGKATCCSFLMFTLSRPLSEDEARWANLHPGVHVEGDSLRIDTPCSALDHGRCSLFGSEERPAMCVRYPELPQQLLVGCSYEMKEVAQWQP